MFLPKVNITFSLFGCSAFCGFFTIGWKDMVKYKYCKEGTKENERVFYDGTGVPVWRNFG